MFRILVALYCAAALTACNATNGESGARSSGTLQSQISPAGLKLVPLTISSNGKQIEFTVELAETSEQQARGMMFRTELAPDAGMLFPFVSERMASFWMKNTVIPLDIIFIRSDGSIESIAANTTPYSLDPVRSAEPVAAVLELAGGRAAEMGIGPGDKISW